MRSLFMINTLILLALSACLQRPTEIQPRPPGTKKPGGDSIPSDVTFTDPNRGVYNPTNLKIMVKGAAVSREGDLVIIETKVGSMTGWSVEVETRAASAADILLDDRPNLQNLKAADVKDSFNKTRSYWYKPKYNSKMGGTGIEERFWVVARDVSFCKEVYNTQLSAGAVQAIGGAVPDVPTNPEDCGKFTPEVSYNFDQVQEIVVRFINENSKAEGERQARLEIEAEKLCMAVGGMSGIINSLTSDNDRSRDPVIVIRPGNSGADQAADAAETPSETTDTRNWRQKAGDWAKNNVVTGIKIGVGILNIWANYRSIKMTGHGCQ